MHKENETSPFVFINDANKQTDNNNQNIKYTNLFMYGRGSGSVFLDLSTSDIDKATLLQEITKQYPTRIGILTKQAGDRMVAEINFDPNDKAINTILEKGVCFDNQFTIIPCKAIDDNMDIVYASLYSLPFTSEKELGELLEETLSEYGDVLDVGIFLESTTKTYMCTGYTILNVSPKAEPYTPLSHKIPCLKSYVGSFYASWKGMPDYCHYCHVQDHITDTCPNTETGERVWKDEGNDDVEIVQGFPQYLNFLIRKKRREHINLEVKGQDGSVTRFKIKRRTELRKLMSVYCKQHHLPPPNVQFFHKGQPLAHDKTPDEMNMEDNDVIIIKIEVIR
ncbi:hypothetical protein K501DRAFT_247893 [Backusella circina FSU 941]|nr:hypothetical protein K501DRAFT_247893 [Backusella circina FSU 941]